jgi:hypothetical protein
MLFGVRAQGRSGGNNLDIARAAELLMKIPTNNWKLSYGIGIFFVVFVGLSSG